jgi:hypothetical protein
MPKTAAVRMQASTERAVQASAQPGYGRKTRDRVAKRAAAATRRATEIGKICEERFAAR